MAEEIVTKPAAETDGELKTWKRRGLLAAAWAAVAAIVARQTTAPLEAGVDGDVVLGGTNTETSGTIITNTSSTFSEAMDLSCNGGTDNWGLFSMGSGYGVYGATGPSGMPAAAGVFGQTSRADSYGILGHNDGAAGTAVLGQSTSGIGVFGTTLSGTSGVRGEVPSGSSFSIAVYGANNSSYAGPGPGAGGFGVYGLSAKGHGLVGATAAAGGGAMVGATNGVAGAYAGLFYGPVIVSGAFTVLGAKSAAVPHPDGSHRLLYCMESPESWFEDFGKGQLQCGRADVTIDPNFAAVADMDDYHVFVTVYEQHNDLMVSERTSHGFRVQARDDASSGAFSWRVVAKRKDIIGERLARVTIPPEPQLPTPSTFEAPALPARGTRTVRQ